MSKEKIYLGARILLGLLFTVFGANGLLMVTTGNGFIPMPKMEPEVMEAMSGFFKIGYLMPLVKVLEVVSGLLLLSNRFVNLALTFLAPIIVNILCVHLFIDLSGLPMAIFVLILFVTIICSRWDESKIVFKK